MTTASTVWPPSSSKSVLVVRPESASDVATGTSEVMRKASSSRARSALGTSRMSANDAAPRVTQPITWRRRNAGSPPAANQASSSVCGHERIAGLASFTRGLRYGLEYVFAVRQADAHASLVDQLLQVRAHRHLGRDHQLVADARAVNALGQLAGRAASARQLGANLRLAVEPVGAVLLELRPRVLDRVPVAWKQDRGVERDQPVERPDVSGYVALRVGDHRAAPAQDEVAREHRTVSRQPEREVICAVPRRVEGREVEIAHAHDVAVAQLGIPAHGGLVKGGEAICQGQVVRVRVSDQH